MQTEKTTIKKFTLDHEEAKLVRTCLDYALHRVIKHTGTGISNVVDRDKLTELRDQFREGLI